MLSYSHVFNSRALSCVHLLYHSILHPCSRTMSSAKQRQKTAIDSLACKIEVGDKVYRRFDSHELGKHDKEQWIHGKVTASKLPNARAPKKSSTWWTLSFDLPARRPLMCKADEVVAMKIAAENYRHKKTALLQHVGKDVAVCWSQEDQDLSFGDWASELRIAVVSKFIVQTQQFMLRFKCGYEKIVGADELMTLFEDSESFVNATKVKIVNSLRLAKNEWKTNGTEKEQSMLAASLAVPLLQAGTSDQLRETVVKDNQLKLAKQRQSVLDMQQLEASAARQLQENVLSRLQREQDEAAEKVRQQIQIQKCAKEAENGATVTAQTTEGDEIARERMLFKIAQEQASARIAEARNIMEENAQARKIVEENAQTLQNAAKAAEEEANVAAQQQRLEEDARTNANQEAERLAHAQALLKLKEANEMAEKDAELRKIREEHEQVLKEAREAAEKEANIAAQLQQQLEEDARTKARQEAEQVAHAKAAQLEANLVAKQQQLEEDARAKAKHEADVVAHEQAMLKQREDKEQAQKDAETRKIREEQEQTLTAAREAAQLEALLVARQQQLKEDARAKAKQESEQLAHEQAMRKLKEDKEQAQKEAALQKIREEEELARQEATAAAQAEAIVLAQQKQLEVEKEQARLQQEVEHEAHLKAMQKRWDDNRLAVDDAVKAAEMEAALTAQNTPTEPGSGDPLLPGSPGDVNDTEMDGEEEGLGNDTTPHARGTDNKIGAYAPEQQRAFEEWQRRDTFATNQRAARFNEHCKDFGLGRDATTWYRGKEVPDTARKTPNISEGADAPMAASSPAPPGAPEQLMAMFQGFFQQQQQQLQEMQFQQ
jgi:hypothetical protein